MITRHITELFTPGRQTLGKPEIVRFDQVTADDWNKLQTRRRELAARLAEVKSEQEQITVNLGAWVAEGCDYKEYTDRLRELRAEVEAIQAGIVYLDNQAALLKRSNPWLKSR